MVYVAPTVRSVGDATTAADYNIIANSVIDLNLARVPVGALTPYAGSTAPTGYLLCFGQAVSQTTYADLYAVIAGTYDSTSAGAGNFRVPDLRGRGISGLDNMGGTDAGRLSWQNVRGTVGTSSILTDTGTETHTLTTAQLSVHSHSFGTQVAYNNAGFSGQAFAFGGGHWGVTQANNANTAGSLSGTADSGSGSAHNNMPPTILLNYIIKT